MTEMPQMIWLRERIAELEADQAVIDEDENRTTGLTSDEEHKLAQYRYQLEQHELAEKE